MKKTLALLLALMMLMSLCACGKDEPSISGALNGGATTDTTPAPEPSNEPEPTQEPAPTVEMTTIETGMFTVSFPTEDGWVYEEDDIYDASYCCSLDLEILDENGYSAVYLRIYASEDNPSEYREALYSRGFDEYALVEENAYDFVTVGGQQLLQWDERSGDCRYYFGRNESAGVNLSIRISYAPDDERVGRVLDNLEFHIEEIGNVDGPWYWEGEPFSRESMSAMAGTFTLNSEFIPMAEPLITHEVFDHDIEIVGDKAYILSDGVLLEYAYDGASLTYLQDIDLGGEYDLIDAAEDGTLLLSAFMEPYIGYRDGAVTFSYNGLDYFAAAPDGTWGLTYFTTPADVEKCTLSGGALTSEPMPLNELSLVTGIWIDDTYIYAAGTSAETSSHTVFVYDHAGNLQKTLLGEDGRLGSVTFVTKTANGFLALDGNMRSVVLWTADGTFIGEIDDRDIFGTNYPWFCAADVQPDGSIVLIMTEDRDDDSAMELVAFRLTGF